MNKIKITTDIVYNDYPKKDIVIIHIADIHFNKDTKIPRLNRLKDHIIKIKPDYIMITGDIIDTPSITNDSKKIKELVSFLSDISKVCKVLISLGNHDIFKNEDFKFFNKLNDLYNIYILNNTSYQDEYIFVTGFTLPGEYYYNITGDESEAILLSYLDNNKNLLNKLPSGIPKIALIHSPIKIICDNVLKRLKDYDIILSGHTHAGMVPDFMTFLFPGNTGIISPRKKLFPKIAKGKIEKEVNNKRVTIIINGAVTNLSLNSGKILSKLNFVYNTSVNKIIIRKKRGKIYG